MRQSQDACLPIFRTSIEELVMCRLVLPVNRTLERTCRAQNPKRTAPYISTFVQLASSGKVADIPAMDVGVYLPAASTLRSVYVADFET